MSILIVDDSFTQRDLLCAILQHGGYSDLLTVSSGQEALDCLEPKAEKPNRSPIDLILMDLDMPGMNGMEACQRIKAVERLRDIPIIMVTAHSEDTVLEKAFAAGVMDFIPRPSKPSEILARVRSALRLKEEIDQRKEREKSLQMLNQNLENVLSLLQSEREKSENLLLNILPEAVAGRLKRGEAVVADHFPEVSVMFIDVVGFTSLASRVTPATLVGHLNRLFRHIDGLVKRHGLEKIKTTGDAYLVGGGVPTPHRGHLEAMAELALDLQHDLATTPITPADRLAPPEDNLGVRIGIHVGPVVGGVIGDDRFIYDIWGDTVNVASRMQTNCPPRQILTTKDVYRRLKESYVFEPLGIIPIKGRGEMEVFVLNGRKAAP